MKKVVTTLSRSAARTVVAALAARGIAGMTLIEAAPATPLVSNGARPDGEGRVRLEIVIESHRADEVIETIEALLDSVESVDTAAPLLVVEDVSTIVHIRSGRVLV